MAYATITDIQARMSRDLTEDEQNICTNLLDDSAVIIDAYNAKASAERKKVVSCRMVIRALGNEETNGVPMGASQGSMAAMGYSQSWTLGSGATVGELYLNKTDKKLLSVGNAIGSYSPVQELVPSKEVASI